MDRAEEFYCSIFRWIISETGKYHLAIITPIDKSGRQKEPGEVKLSGANKNRLNDHKAGKTFA